MISFLTKSGEPESTPNENFVAKTVSKIEIYNKHTAIFNITQ